MSREEQRGAERESVDRVRVRGRVVQEPPEAGLRSRGRVVVEPLDESGGVREDARRRSRPAPAPVRRP
jgi:hypothetical protein